MGKYFRIWLLILLCSGWHSSFSQEDEPALFMNGYLKEMLISDFSPEDSSLWTNLLHNRLNFKWYPNDNISGYFELRTRLYFGDYVSTIPNFTDGLDDTEDYFNLSWLIVDEEYVAFHTMIDRLYFQWQKDDWDVKAGRQRINWGVNLVWNPNDLFNAFSFIDFDYEERPGTDAIRVQKYTGFASSFDVAANIADSLGDFVTAGRWATNKWNYDFQLIGGFARNDMTVGGAWAGNIKTSGFKGEFTYFHPVNGSDLNPALVGTLSWDYSWLSGFYILASYLHNTDGEVNLGLDGFLGLYDRALTARNLSPYKHSGIIQVSYPFSPLINGGISTMFFPGSSALFINPFVTVSLVTNLDFDLIGQIFYDEHPVTEKWGSLSQVFYYRLKWSF